MKKTFFLSCFLFLFHQISFAMDTEKDHLTINQLLHNYDQHNTYSSQEFKKALRQECQNIFDLEVIDEEKINKLFQLSRRVLFTKHEYPRFNTINSPYFTVFVDVFASFIRDQSPSIMTSQIAKILTLSYRSIISETGLPLDDLRIKNCLKWHNYIINSEIIDPINYIDSCIFVAALYARRAQKTCDAATCNRYIKTAFKYLEKGAIAIKMWPVEASTINDYFRQTGLILQAWSKTNAPSAKKCRTKLMPALEHIDTKLKSLSPSSLGFFKMFFAQSNVE